MGLSLRKLASDLRYGRPVSPHGVREREFRFPGSWDERIRLAVASPDNAHIARVPGAGNISDGRQMMHNGLIVRADGYYGADVTRLLEANRGVHEPQEERVFAAALPHIRRGGRIVELGAYWAFYSAWFLTVVPQGRAVLVEPETANLEIGRENLRLNGVEERAEFIQGYVGRLRPHGRPPGAAGVGVDELVESRALDRIDILHADVQGAEADMLAGAVRSLRRGIVDWVFISTHTMRIHARCRRLLERAGYRMVAEADLPESYSYDGLLVFKRAGAPGPDRVEISQRPYPVA